MNRKQLFGEENPDDDKRISSGDQPVQNIKIMTKTQSQGGFGINNLAGRLYDKGFNLRTMPSVKRETNQNQDKVLTANLTNLQNRKTKLVPLIYQPQSVVLHNGKRVHAVVMPGGQLEQDGFNQSQMGTTSYGGSGALTQFGATQQPNFFRQTAKSTFNGQFKHNFGQQNDDGAPQSRGIQIQSAQKSLRGESQPPLENEIQPLNKSRTDNMDFKNFMYKTHELFPQNPLESGQKLQTAQSQNKLPPLDRSQLGSAQQQNNNANLGSTQVGFKGSFMEADKAFLKINGFSDVEMDRTKRLVGRISGKQNIDQRYRNTMGQTGGFGSFKKKKTDDEELDQNQQHPLPDYKGEFTIVQSEEQQNQLGANFEKKGRNPKLDLYIELILKNVVHVHEFQYLIRDDKDKDDDDPYNLIVADYKDIKAKEKAGTLKEFYTISKKGLTHYINGKPVEFIGLAVWMKEREHYDQIKSLKFFTKFRKWKTLKMWRKNVIKHKTATCAKALNEKLFILNKTFRDTILQFRSNTYDMMESQRFISVDSNSYTGADSTYTLDEFKNLQEQTRKKITDKIQEYSKKCRTIVKSGFDESLNELRRNVYMANNEEDYQNSRKQNQNFFRLKESAYENLGFSDNMNYEQRSELRKVCTKFLRFSYLVDFLAMESLSNIFKYSVAELENKLTCLVDEDFFYEQQKLKNNQNMNNDPLFLVEINPGFEPIPDDATVIDPIKEFMPKPFGEDTEKQFNILHHVRLKEPKKKTEEQKASEVKQKRHKKQNQDGEEEDEEDDDDEEEEGVVPDENRTYNRKIVPTITEKWIRISPDRETIISDILRCIAEGTNSIQAFERWSRHDDMTIYVSVLEEWDDMVGDDWEHPDTNYLNPQDWIDGGSPQDKFQKTFRELISSAFSRCDSFIKDSFHKYLIEYWENEQIDLNIFRNEKLLNPGESFNWTLKKLTDQKEVYEKEFPDQKDLGLLRLDFKTLRKKIINFPNEIIKKFSLFMPEMIRLRNIEVKDWMNNAANLFKGGGANIDEFVKRSNNLKVVQRQLPKYKQKFSDIQHIRNIIIENKFDMKKEDVSAIIETQNVQKRLEQTILSAEELAERNIENYIRDVKEDLIPKLIKQVGELDSQIQNKKYLSEELDINVAIKELEGLYNDAKKLEDNSKLYNHYEHTLGLPISRFEDLEMLLQDANLRYLMWKSLKEWKELILGWVDGKFKDINTEEIKNKAEYYSKIVARCDKKLPQNAILTELKKLVTDFRNTMPIVLALRNENLKDYHWRDIKKIIGEFEINDEFTLKKLIDMKVVDFMEEIQEISIQATQEASLEKQFQEISEKWNKQEFTLAPYKHHQPRTKDAYVLDQIDELFAAIDEYLANLNNILGSRYLKKIREEVEKFQKNVLYSQECIDDMLAVQKNWIYLENIFSSNEIKSKLREETQQFEGVDKFFKNQMSKANKGQGKLIHKFIIQPSKSVAAAPPPTEVQKDQKEGDKKEVKTQKNDTLSQWRKHKDTLNSIQKALDDYLEDKRGEFPRFYFLSNDELIEILAKAGDIEAIQRNLKKCFDGIYRLNIDSNNSIKGMISPEGETIEFNKFFTAKGEVEKWLLQVQEQMRESLKKAIKKGKQDIDKDNKERRDWVLQHPAQVVATVSNIMWTQSTEIFIQQQGDVDADNPLENWYKINIQQLQELTSLITQGLDPLKHKSIVALITQDVHARDIVYKLWEEGTCSVNDFEWQKQLRYYYYEEPENEVQVKQVNAKIKYGNEYLGATTRLVITPLTDRCWITITGALNIKLGASPAGPAGTGKTESTKDLAKAFGVFCVVFNCSDQIEYQMMGRLFSGLAQQGAWACLDEFNRIDIEVLSVIAQQLLTIRQALMKGIKDDEKFLFIDRMIPLKADGYGVFITMNPGYAGRTELPDNLKILFRPVSMMIPDYRLIAEIMLFAEGFVNANPLSKKMVQLYTLSSQQLSQQDHYDFGMRAVKSVLVMAGALKRAQPDLKEDVVLIRAMRDSNVPKFLKDDLPLFSALIQDLFPNEQIPDPDYGELPEQIDLSFERLNFQKVEELKNKVIQLFETFNVRFGVMLVGATTSGKTACFRTLADSMSQLRKKGSKDIRFQEVKTHILNPKCITMGELYGQVNPNTQEWQDGLASQIMRETASDETELRQWVVFDGPVDALWIENMNTVLDDNMMLCLANGQRIKLRTQMRMLFEVQDLRVASPATVSRCGMVYLMYENLGWRPFVQSWIEKKFTTKLDLNDQVEVEEVLSKELRTHLYTLFDEKVDFFLDHIRKMKEPIATCDLQLVNSLCNLIECFISEEYGFKKNERPDFKKRYLDHAFAFAFIWSMCSTVNEANYDKLDILVRDKFPLCIFPNQGTVYSFFLDVGSQQHNDLTFRHWNDKTPEFVYDKEIPYFNLLVPTLDTVRYSFFTEWLLSFKKHMYLTGMSGTGKSVILSTILTQISETRNVDHFSLIFSAQTSSKVTQLTIEGKLEKIKKTLLGAKPNRKTAVFIDDINMPSVEEYGAQPPIELLRFFVDKGGLYDRKERFWKDIQDTILCICSAPPGGGRSVLTPRFTRHFNLLCVPQPTRDILFKIFESILTGFFNTGFPDTVKRMADAIVNGTIDVYQTIAIELKAKPSKFHYTFNLRDVSKVFQGIMMTSPYGGVRDENSATKLWIHEVQRVFHDRLINDEDRDWFYEYIMQLLGRHFKSRLQKSEIFGSQQIVFSDILRLDLERKEYEDLTDKMQKVIRVLDDKQDEYNSSTTNNKMSLVFFDACIYHILRILRVLRSLRGNAMLIGVGGSGKQSLTKLATFMLEYKLSLLEITKGFDSEKFRDFIKELMKDSGGAQGKGTTFIFTDNQIVYESFLEDINNILNSGEVPNLWQQEDKDALISDVREINKKLRRAEDPDTIYKTFVERVRNNLHIVLCMSPVGDALRVRHRKFPSLVDCCALDWFSPWPSEALISVATSILTNDQNFPTPSTITKEELIEQVAFMCKEVHIQASKQAEVFEQQLKRKVYYTPKSYLDLIKLYQKALLDKRAEFITNQSRLSSGLTKLEQANKSVAQLQIDLTELKPQLEEKTIQVNEKLREVEKDSNIAAEKEAIVQEEAEKVQKQADRIQLISDEAQAELNKVMPELEAAMQAVQNLDKSALSTLRGMASPPQQATITFEAVAALMGEKKTDWASVKQIFLVDVPKFIDKMIGFDKDNIPDDRLKKLNKVLAKPEFNLEDIKKNLSYAHGLASFCLAMKVYADVNSKVKPKKIEVARLNNELNAVKAELYEKESELKKVKDNVQRLQMETQLMVKQREELETNKELTEQRLDRAQKLIQLTADEQKRWEKTVVRLGGEIENLFGDVFLSTAQISYNGPFTGKIQIISYSPFKIFEYKGAYRKELNQNWLTMIREKNIPTSEQYNLIKTLGDPMLLREWVIQGLPSDQVSQENSIFAVKGYRWPLLIDPQLQANKWIKNMEKQNKLSIFKFSTPKFLDIVKLQVENGYSILIEDVDSSIDPAIDSVVNKEFSEVDGRLQLKLGGKDINYHKDFALYMTTKKPNPSYLPEIFIKVNVINFTATFEGLEDQLLADVVKNEKPEVEHQRDENVLKLATFQKQIIQSEKEILRLLAEAKAEKILDDVNLIKTLQNAKEMAEEINQQIAKSMEIEKSIDATRSSYRSVSIRGSILFFVIKDLSLIDPMYQYSLQYISKLFNYAMQSSEQTDDFEQRLKILIDNITKTIFTNVTRGLFEKDKLIFSFLIATSINKHANILNEDIWRILLRGAGLFDKSKQPPNPDKTMIQPLSWDLAYSLEIDFPEQFKGFTKHISSKLALWKEYQTSEDPLSKKLPEEWHTKLDEFEKIVVLKIFRPEKIMFAISNYVQYYLGKFYVEQPSVTMERIHADSDISTPIVFVLSQGADPTTQILSFAQQREMNEKLKIISLGQGQGKKASILIEEGKREGNWVCLLNCHLARTWMPDLELIIEKIPESENVSNDFRIFLTSMPASYFPVSVLQNGIKITTEPPRGFKANLKRSWDNLTDEFLNDCTKADVFHKLTWGLTFFHAIIQERRKFGPLGWNIRYEFNDSDLETSTTVMRKLLDEQESIPWDALLFVTGEINYGGRVTDDWDRRCLTTILKKFYVKEALEGTYQFSDSPVYKIPRIGNIEQYREYIESLPLNEDPSVFGMNENANIAYQGQESTKMLETILSIQPRMTSASAGKTPDSIVLDLKKSLEEQTPQLLNKDDGNKELFEKDENDLIPSLSTVLLQEMIKFNLLISTVNRTLGDLGKAIDGDIVMSSELDQTYNSLLNNQVPKQWEKVSYPSLKPLASWIIDLRERVQFMAKWLKEGTPFCYWISGFFFPQGFLTGVLQTYARSHKIPIDELQFSFRILDFDKEQCTTKPTDGVNIYGLYLEGAQWDRRRKSILDAAPNQTSCYMPVILFNPTKQYQEKSENYACPVYKTSVRAGVLSTTGQSTNYVLTVDVPSIDQNPDFWVLRGAALLCQLNQ
ncbi:hypothetical protein ABPG72_006991 [Tetrahymena utriculariae]